MSWEGAGLRNKTGRHRIFEFLHNTLFVLLYLKWLPSFEGRTWSDFKHNLLPVQWKISSLLGSWGQSLATFLLHSSVIYVSSSSYIKAGSYTLHTDAWMTKVSRSEIFDCFEFLIQFCYIPIFFWFYIEVWETFGTKNDRACSIGKDFKYICCKSIAEEKTQN